MAKKHTLLDEPISDETWTVLKFLRDIEFSRMSSMILRREFRFRYVRNSRNVVDKEKGKQRETSCKHETTAFCTHSRAGEIVVDVVVAPRCTQWHAISVVLFHPHCWKLTRKLSRTAVNCRSPVRPARRSFKKLSAACIFVLRWAVRNVVHKS